MSFRFRFLASLTALTALLASPRAFAQSYDGDGNVVSDPSQGQYQGDYQQAPADDFYSELSPYGEWVEVPGYGRVWRPYSQSVGADFRPYATGGHWVYTDYGWSFESDYSWGWAPFHYGRWMIRPAYGWVWIPGRVWAPAWVDWRFGGGLVGWAPLAPVGVSIYADAYRPYWCFVHTASFVSPNVYVNLVPAAQVHYAFNATAVVTQRVAFNGVRFNAGPSPVHIAAAVGQPIRAVALHPPLPGSVQQVRLASTPGRAPAFLTTPVQHAAAPRLNARAPQSPENRVAAPQAVPLPRGQARTLPSQQPAAASRPYTAPGPMRSPPQPFRAPQPQAQSARPQAPQAHYQQPPAVRYQPAAPQRFQAPQARYQQPPPVRYQPAAPQRFQAPQARYQQPPPVRYQPAAPQRFQAPQARYQQPPPVRYQPAAPQRFQAQAPMSAGRSGPSYQAPAGRGVGHGHS